MSDVFLDNEIKELVKWVPDDVREQFESIWMSDKKMGVVNIRDYSKYTVTYVTISWCYWKARVSTISFSTLDKSKYTTISKLPRISAVERVFPESLKHAEFVDRYVKNKIKNTLKENDLYYDFEIYDSFTSEPNIAVLSDGTGKIAIIRTGRNEVIIVTKSRVKVTWIPESMPLNFDSVKWTFNEEFANIKDFEKYLILEKL